MNRCFFNNLTVVTQQPKQGQVEDIGEDKRAFVFLLTISVRLEPRFLNSYQPNQ